MTKNMKLLGSRRSYQFGADDLRLSVLSTQEVQDLVSSEFRFQVLAYGTPAPTFGPVPQTVPAGVVFNTGSWSVGDGQIVPIRFLHFEPQRIVIDVAGPSAAIGPVFDHLRSLVQRMVVPGIGSVIGEPECILDYSEYTAQYHFPLTSLLSAPVRDAIEGALRRSDVTKDFLTVPTLMLSPVPPEDNFDGVNLGDGRNLQFALRKGTRPEDRVYFSAAPLDSDAHAAYLQRLAEVLESGSG